MEKKMEKGEKVRVSKNFEIILPEWFLHENHIIPSDELIVGCLDNKQMYCRKK